MSKKGNILITGKGGFDLKDVEFSLPCVSLTLETQSIQDNVLKEMQLDSLLGGASA